MNKKLAYYFYTSLFVAVVVYVLQKMNIHLPLVINSYLNDFLIVPIVLTISLLVLQKMQNKKKYRIPFIVVMYVALMYAFIFEYMLPKFYVRYTSDIIDVILYFISGFVFFFLQKIER